MAQPTRNITISGLPGCGSTTLLNRLRESLKFEGWKGFSGGEFMRAYALEKGLFKEDEEGELHHSAAHYEDDFDRQIDLGMRSKLESEEHWILEAWLSGFMAQQVPNVLKILMYCSDDAIRIDRVVNRDGVTPADAKANMERRYQENLTKWQRMYAQEWQEWVIKPGLAKPDEPIDFWKPDLYDVQIDTYSHNQDQCLEIVLHALGQENHHLSP